MTLDRPSRFWSYHQVLSYGATGDELRGSQGSISRQQHLHHSSLEDSVPPPAVSVDVVNDAGTATLAAAAAAAGGTATNNWRLSPVPLPGGGGSTRLDWSAGGTRKYTVSSCISLKAWNLFGKITCVKPWLHVQFLHARITHVTTALVEEFLRSMFLCCYTEHSLIVLLISYLEISFRTFEFC